MMDTLTRKFQQADALIDNYLIVSKGAEIEHFDLIEKTLKKPT